MTVNPFNSINELKKQAPDRVYHNNNKCASGNDIPKKERRPGTTGYRLCQLRLATSLGFIRTFGDCNGGLTQDFVSRRYQAAYKTRCRSRSNLARPYICRSISFSR
jgi:hypothetical protein